MKTVRDKRYTAEAKEDDYILVHMTGSGYYLKSSEARRLFWSLAEIVGVSALDKTMAELCSRLRERFEASGHPVCPDPECDYVAYENTEHAPDCRYMEYVRAQDVAITTPRNRPAARRGRREV